MSCQYVYYEGGVGFRCSIDGSACENMFNLICRKAVQAARKEAADGGIQSESPERYDSV